MAIFIIKPVTEDNGTMVGGNMVFESSSAGTDVAQHFAQSTLNASYPEAGITATQLSDSDWADTAPGWRFQLYRISGVGSSGTTTPTIQNVTASELVSEFWHSNHSNSVNGNAYSSSVGNYSPNFGSSTFSTTNEVISFDYSANISGAFVPADVQRTQSNDNGNVYYNGILVSSNYGGSGQSEWWEIQTTADPDEQTTKYVATNNDNLIDTSNYYPRTDVTFVKKALTGAKTDDARDNALAYILAHLETNGDNKKLPQRYRKIRTALDISSIETLENDYRTHSA